ADSQTRRSDELRKKITGSHDRPGNQLGEEGNRQNEIAQRSGGLQDAAINIERVRKRMEGVERNADRQKDVEVRWMIDDADAREKPLEIFQQEVSVFEKTEHAQVHADTADEPGSLRRLVLGFGNLPAQPKIHRGGGKEKRSKGWVPGAVENVARGHQQVLPRIPGADAPVEGHYDHEEENEGERIEKHERLRLRI